MNILLYAGQAPWRDLVLTFSKPILARAASRVTLVTREGPQAQALLDHASEVLAIPAHVVVEQQIRAGNTWQVILNAAEAQSYDMAILGRLNHRLGRLLSRRRSKTILRRLNTSGMRVHGIVRPVKRILLASGGNAATFANARLAARLATAMDASITLIHVLSQEQLCFELIPDWQTAQQEFPYSETPEAVVLNDTMRFLEEAGVTAALQIRVGPVLDELMAELASGGYDLLVIGTHQATDALDRLLLENMTNALLDYSPLPVLVVKNTTNQGLSFTKIT